MNDIWFCSDHHLGHKSIINFKGYNEDPARTIFSSIEEHNEYLVECHNKVVKPNDKVYMLGDICWNSSSVNYLKRMAGNKFLIMGNHDKQKTKSYLNCVHELRGCLYLNELKAILTHIPVHPGQLEHRFECNIHGHLHTYNINDPKYLNVSMEQINYTPINLEEARLRLKLQKETYEND